MKRMPSAVSRLLAAVVSILYLLSLIADVVPCRSHASGTLRACASGTMTS